MGVEFTRIGADELKLLKEYISTELRRPYSDETKVDRDRRQAQRAKVDFDLSVRVERGYAFYTGQIQNISSNGIFIFTREEHPVGSKLSIRFKIPALDKTIETTGVVRWCLPRPAGKVWTPGIGVEFAGLGEETTELLEEYIADKNVIKYQAD